MSGERAVIVLAAGRGKRMRSDIPKVLHEIHGRPLITHLMDTLASLSFARKVVVIGFKGELVQQALASYDVEFVWQREQLGTGHAVQMTADRLSDFAGPTLVALGDVPFLSAESIERLFTVHERTAAAVTCLTARLDDPSGYGRVVREGKSDQMREIVEEADATEEIRAIREINTGTMCFETGLMFDALKDVGNDNVQGEYYLTDAIGILRRRGQLISVVRADDPDRVLGVNSAEQLRQLAARFPKPAAEP